MVARDDALYALNREVSGHAFEYATGLDVTDGGPAGFLVRVRAGQRPRPATLVVAADERSLARDHSVDEPLPVDDVEMWACGGRIWLAEQLDTGVLRWGRRLTLPDGTAAIDPSIRPGPASPWWVSPVPLVRPTPPGQRQLRRAARSRRGGGVVTLGGSIEFQPDPAPGGHLRHAGLHAAADAGARVIEHRLDDRDLLQSGLPWRPADGAMRLNAADIP